MKKKVLLLVVLLASIVMTIGVGISKSPKAFAQDDPCCQRWKGKNCECGNYMYQDWKPYAGGAVLETY